MLFVYKRLTELISETIREKELDPYPPSQNEVIEFLKGLWNYHSDSKRNINRYAISCMLYYSFSNVDNLNKPGYGYWVRLKKDASKQCFLFDVMSYETFKAIKENMEYVLFQLLLQDVIINDLSVTVVDNNTYMDLQDLSEMLGKMYLKHKINFHPDIDLQDENIDYVPTSLIGAQLLNHNDQILEKCTSSQIAQKSLRIHPAIIDSYKYPLLSSLPMDMKIQ